MKHNIERAGLFICCFALFPLATCLASSTGAVERDPQAIQYLNSALTALGSTGQITSISMQATVQYQMGGSTYPGSGALEGVGNSESRITLTLPVDPILEIHQGIAGVWAGADGQNRPISTHNCATSPVWFSPHLFLSTAVQTATYALVYVGAETWNGSAVQHIQIQRTDLFGGADLGATLSSTDVYLDASSNLPTGFVFNQHPDENALYNIPIRIQFSNYTASGNVNYPATIVKLVNATVLYTFSITAFVVNPVISPSDFNF